MKKIMIEGNGIFYNFRELELEAKQINIRFKKWVSIFIEKHNKIYGEFSEGNKEIISELQKVINELKEEEDYEDKFGLIVSLIVDKYDLDKDMGEFNQIYEFITSTFVGIIFMKLNIPGSWEELSTYKRIRTYDLKYRLNYIDINGNDSTPLHGHCDPLSWTNRILHTHLNHAIDSEELVFLLNYHGEVRSYINPPLLGKDIEQKNKLLSIMRGREYFEYKKLFADPNISGFEKMLSDKNYSYQKLKTDSIGAEIDLVGINMKNHVELLDWIINAKQINVYCKTEEDLSFSKTLEQKYNNIKTINGFDKVYELKKSAS